MHGTHCQRPRDTEEVTCRFKRGREELKAADLRFVENNDLTRCCCERALRGPRPIMHECCEESLSAACKYDGLKEFPDCEKSTCGSACVIAKCDTFTDASDKSTGDTESESRDYGIIEADLSVSGETASYCSVDTDKAVHACPVLAHCDPKDTEEPLVESRRSLGEQRTYSLLY